LTLFACFANAVRVFFGSLEIVLFLRAALAAFLMATCAIEMRTLLRHRPGRCGYAGPDCGKLGA